MSFLTFYSSLSLCPFPVKTCLYHAFFNFLFFPVSLSLSCQNLFIPCLFQLSILPCLSVLVLSKLVYTMSFSTFYSSLSLCPCPVKTCLYHAFFNFLFFPVSLSLSCQNLFIPCLFQFSILPCLSVLVLSKLVYTMSFSTFYSSLSLCPCPVKTCLYHVFFNFLFFPVSLSLSCQNLFIPCLFQLSILPCLSVLVLSKLVYTMSFSTFYSSLSLCPCPVKTCLYHVFFNFLFLLCVVSVVFFVLHVTNVFVSEEESQGLLSIDGDSNF